MILSDGVLVKSPTTLWEGDTRSFQGFSSIGLTGGRWASYAELYKQQLWVSTAVNKRANATARLPLKTYLRDDMNRPEATGPYADLIARPSSKHPPFFFWLWTSSTKDVYGEAFLGKIRDPGGRPIELVLLHPTAMQPDDVKPGREQTWTFQNGTIRVEGIPQSDLVHFKTYNPDTLLRGFSPLEPLRRTLEFEDAAQRAQSAFWRNGARPGTALVHPGKLTQEAGNRLKLQWESVASGADKTGATVVLEEGMKPETLTLTAEEAQYIESRKLNREEVCAGYDIPPPVLHILDRATFSNITEQMRSMYRDTMAPHLKSLESTLEMDLRASRRPGASDPDFGGDVYAEFLLDEVLRGDFEARATAYQQADYMTMAEKRRAENLPFIDGTQSIFVNAATVPLDAAALNVVAGLIAAGFDPAAVLAALNLPPIDYPDQPTATELSQPAMRTLMTRLSRFKSLDEIDADALTAGISEDRLVAAALSLSVDAGHSVPEFRDCLKAIAGGAP